MLSLNAERGEKLVKIGEIELVLEPSFERIAKCESSLGLSLVQLVGEYSANKRMSFLEIATTIKCFVKDSDPKAVTVQQLGTAIATNGGLLSATKILTDFLSEILLGKKVPDSEGNVPAEADQA